MKTSFLTPDYQVFDLLLEGIQVINHDWQCVYANHTITMQRKDKEDMLGRSMMALYPEIRYTPLFEALETCMIQRVSQSLTCELTYTSQSRDKFDFLVFPVESGILIISRNKTGNAATTHKVSWEYAYQIEERENRAKELISAHEELVVQYQEKKNRAAELMLADIELCFQNGERQKRAEEFLEQTRELADSESSLLANMKGLEEMMFLTSHKVRRPIANILGITAELENYINSPEDLKELILYLRQSATALESFTHELTVLMGNLAMTKKCEDKDGSDQ